MTARSHRRKISFADLETTFRRTGAVYPPPNPQAQAVSAAQQQQATHEELRRREAARRQARRPTDRGIPNELATVCIGDGVDRYRGLRDVERKLDAAMMQKRIDIFEDMNTQMRREGTLRIWISNTAEGQPWQLMEEGGEAMGEDGNFDFGENGQATYRVKIEGRLLEEQDESPEKDGDAMDEDTQKQPPPPAAATGREKTKLSHFFKSITIDVDRPASLQPDGYSSIEWKRPSPQNPTTSSTDSETSFDSLEFQRKGDEEMNITINLARDETPERFKLSKPLANLLDTEEEDRAGVVAGIWEYVRAMGLQEDDESRRVVCDEQLQAVFGMDTLFFPYIPEMIHNHLSPLPPIQLAYTIRLDKAYISPPTSTSDTKTTSQLPSAPTIYDITVPLPSETKKQMQSVISSPTHLSNLKAITQIDEDLALLVQKMQHVAGKRRFFDGLARDPGTFIKRWVGSQQRDLEIVLAEAGRGAGDEGYAGEEFRRGGQEGVWGGDLARESVGLWLARNKAH